MLASGACIIDGAAQRAPAYVLAADLQLLLELHAVTITSAAREGVSPSSIMLA